MICASYKGMHIIDTASRAYEKTLAESECMQIFSTLALAPTSEYINVFREPRWSVSECGRLLSRDEKHK